MLERAGWLPINPGENEVPKALKVAISLLEMSNWEISINIKQLGLKKKGQFKGFCLPASRDSQKTLD